MTAPDDFEGVTGTSTWQRGLDLDLAGLSRSWVVFSEAV